MESLSGDAAADLLLVKMDQAPSATAAVMSRCSFSVPTTTGFDRVQTATPAARRDGGMPLGEKEDGLGRADDGLPLDCNVPVLPEDALAMHSNVSNLIK